MTCRRPRPHRRSSIGLEVNYCRFLFALLVTLASGCTTVGEMTTLAEVKAWERDTLSKHNMQLDPDLMDASIDDHIYFSREASTGGRGINGGGCGCN